MITASQARAIIQESDLEVERILSLLDVKIRGAAKEGKRIYAAYNEAPWQSEEVYVPVSTSPLQSKIISRLKLLGFGAGIFTDNQYVPPGLADSDGGGPMHSNRVLKVSW